jgi:translation initiation factor 1A
VVQKYEPNEAHSLKALKELRKNIRLNEGIVGEANNNDEDGASDNEYLEFKHEDIDNL